VKSSFVNASVPFRSSVETELIATNVTNKWQRSVTSAAFNIDCLQIDSRIIANQSAGYVHFRCPFLSIPADE